MHGYCFVAADAVNETASATTQQTGTDVNVDDAAQPVEGDVDEQQQTLSLKGQMEQAIAASMSQPPINNSTTSSGTTGTATSASFKKSLQAEIKTEMSIFQSTGVRGRCLELVYSYLMSIPPTSVEAERAFSAAGLQCTKIRSRLNDDTLDTLCFLRTYYRNHKF